MSDQPFVQRSSTSDDADVHFLYLLIIHSLIRSQYETAEASRKQLGQDLTRSRRENLALKASTRQAKQANERSIARQRDRFSDASILAARNGSAHLTVIPGVFSTSAAGGSGSSGEPSTLYQQQIVQLEAERTATLASNSALRRLCVDGINALTEMTSGLTGYGSIRHLQTDLFPVVGRQLRKNYVLRSGSNGGQHPAVKALGAAIKEAERANFEAENERKAMKEKIAALEEGQAAEEEVNRLQESQAAAARPKASRVPLGSKVEPGVTQTDSMPRDTLEIENLKARLEEMEANLKQAEDLLEEKEELAAEAQRRAEEAERREMEETSRLAAENQAMLEREMSEQATKAQASKSPHTTWKAQEPDMSIDRSASVMFEPIAGQSSARRGRESLAAEDEESADDVSAQLGSGSNSTTPPPPSPPMASRKRQREEVQEEIVGEEEGPSIEEQAASSASGAEPVIQPSDDQAGSSRQPRQSSALQRRPSALYNGARRPRQSSTTVPTARSTSSRLTGRKTSEAGPSSATAAAAKADVSTKRPRLASSQLTASTPAAKSKQTSAPTTTSRKALTSIQAPAASSTAPPPASTKKTRATPVAPMSALQLALEKKRRTGAATAEGRGAAK